MYLEFWIKYSFFYFFIFSSQWMFWISNPRKTNVSQLMTYIKEGGNVAIATNNTIINGTFIKFIFSKPFKMQLSFFSLGSCAMGEECLYHELFKNFAMSLSKLVREEEAIYSQISDEEWESIRLSKRERRDSMLEFIKVCEIKKKCPSNFFLKIICYMCTTVCFMKERLRDDQMCKPCVNWKFESVETWVSTKKWRSFLFINTFYLLLDE